MFELYYVNAQKNKIKKIEEHLRESKNIILFIYLVLKFNFFQF